MADLRIHGTTHQRPIERFTEKARALVPTAGHPSFLQAMVRDRIVAGDWLVSIDANRYSLPFAHFIEHGDNAIVLSPPGVGKTHLAVSLGIKAIEAGYRVLFTTAASLIEKLTKAHAEGRLEEKLKVYTAARLLIIDEIGYLPIDRVGANLFFQLLSRRYERAPMIKARLVRPQDHSSTNPGGEI